MADTEDRTQAPSERRRQQARDEGRAAVSREVVVAASLGAGALVLMMAGPVVAALALNLRGMLTAVDVAPGLALRRAGETWLWATGALLAVVTVASAAAVLLQTGFLVHLAALSPDLARLDPRRGMRRVFGLDNAAETVKAVAKLGLLGWLVASAMAAAWPALATAALWTPGALVARVGREMVHLMLIAAGFQAGIAVLDVAWTRWRHTQRLSMSRDDLKQEQREAEGDPKIKARIRQLRTARARRRMLAAVAKATVVVTNPTHYAVALSYERGSPGAPRVVAKGVDDMAARIRTAAEGAGVAVMANPPLARALYLVALDAEVPDEHFKVVAEIIAYVWRLKDGRLRRA